MLVAGPKEKTMEKTMIRMTAFVLLVALFGLPAIAQTKGRSVTAPGQTQSTPGQAQGTPGNAKTLAPGQLQQQGQPGDAKNLAPGAKQRKQ